MPRGRRPHIKQRSDGRYRVKYKGKEFYGWSEDDAYDAMDAYVNSLTNGAVITNQSVSDYALPWLRRTYPSVADSTYTGLAIHLQHLIDTIGYKRVSEIVPSDIKQIYADHYADLSNTYIKSAKQLYCSLFDSALADGLIRYNPARDKSAKPHRGAKVKERILSPVERQWITTLCVDHRAYPAVMAMLYAGIRPQEAKALDIDRDVDFDKGMITIQETAHVDGYNYAITGELKTEWSNRQVPLFKPLREALEGKHGMLVTTADGEQINLSSWKTLWKSYIYSMETAINGCPKRWYGKKKEHQGVDLPPWKDFDIVPYTLRHAFCAFCRDSGVEINTCRRWMGHADAKMILKVYDSVSTDRSVNEARKVEERLGSKRGSDPETDPSTP